MSFIRRAVALERRGADPHAPWGDSSPPPPSSVGGNIAGTLVTEATALQVAAVHGAMRVLSDAVSSLPIDLMTTPHRRTGSVLPASPLIEQPYSEISVTDWWVQFVISLALRGNFYGHIISRDADLYPTQIKPIHPDNARVRRLPTTGEVEYRFNGQLVPIRDVFHVRYLSVPEALVGLSPVETQRNSFGLARAVDLYAAAFFQNSSRADFAIEVEDDLDPDEVLALAKSWAQGHQGIGQSSLPAVLTGGSKLSNPITVNPQDSQLLESRQLEAAIITGQVFGIPPHMLGIVDRTTSWGTGIEQQEMGFVRNTLIGYLSRGERSLTALHRPGQFVRFDLSERLRGDKLSRYTAYSLGRLGGWLNADGIRADEDLPPLPDGQGQEYLVPINSELLTAAIEAAKQLQQQPPAPGGANDPGDPGGNQ